MTTCNVDGCQNPANSARGMCHKHYKRWHVNGHTGLTNGKGCPDAVERLTFRGKRTESGCLEWTGTIAWNGYGQTMWNYKFYSVHRLAWTLANGPVPDGLHVCHKCDNRKCFDVSHLFLGTAADNVHDAFSKNRRPRWIGEGNPKGKLSAEEAACIRASPDSARTLANRYEICESTVYRIKSGKYWALEASRRRVQV